MVGLGGLGHIAVKIGKALGAEVVVFTTSPSKADDARRLGADDVVLSTDSKEMKRRRGELSFIIDTVSAPHDVDGLLRTLHRDGTLCLVGMPDQLTLAPASLIGGRKRVAGSAIGGLKETQEMLDFCAQHGIVADIEAIGVDQINDAYAAPAAQRRAVPLRHRPGVPRGLTPIGASGDGSRQLLARTVPRSGNGTDGAQFPAAAIWPRISPTPNLGTDLAGRPLARTVPRS